MATFSFDQLNLSAVRVFMGSSLQAGRYICEVKDASLRDTSKGGKQVEVNFEDKQGAGSIRTWLNVHVPDGAEATRIGREQLKSLLIYGGHASPDQPGDIKSLVGLSVGVAVKKEDYQKNGETRSGSRVHFFYDPATGGTGANDAAPPAAARKFDDEIPF
jgi:hypothetical protein